MMIKNLISSTEDEIPLIFGTPKDKTIFTPSDFLEYHLKVHKLKLPKIHENCIICYNREIINLIKRRYEYKKFDVGLGKNNPLLLFKDKKNNIGVVFTGGTGASFTGTLLEELIALGFKNFITLGSAGTLQDNLDVGDVVLPTKAIRDEGTSYHYFKPSKYSVSSKKINRCLRKALRKNNVDFFEGCSWTTDAPYRETVRKARRYKSEGVLCVEMEASALFAIAKHRKKDIGALFYISDSLADFSWNPQFHSRHAKLKRSKLLKIAVDAFHLMEEKC